MEIDLNNLIATLFATFISTIAGGFFASWFFKKLEDQELQSMRNLAIHFIKTTFKYTTFHEKVIYFESDWKNYYSKGEINILDCFIKEIEDAKFYSTNGKLKKKSYKKLIKEIQLGFWDYYLLLDKNTTK